MWASHWMKNAFCTAWMCRSRETASSDWQAETAVEKARSWNWWQESGSRMRGEFSVIQRGSPIWCPGTSFTDGCVSGMRYSFTNPTIRTLRPKKPAVWLKIWVLTGRRCSGSCRTDSGNFWCWSWRSAWSLNCICWTNRWPGQTRHLKGMSGGFWWNICPRVRQSSWQPICFVTLSSYSIRSFFWIMEKLWRKIRRNSGKPAECPWNSIT